MKENEALDLLELTKARCDTASTILFSQFDVPGWHENLYHPTLSDVICDRIIYAAYIMKIEEEFMWKRNDVRL